MFTRGLPDSCRRSITLTAPMTRTCPRCQAAKKLSPFAKDPLDQLDYPSRVLRSGSTSIAHLLRQRPPSCRSGRVDLQVAARHTVECVDLDAPPRTTPSTKPFMRRIAVPAVDRSLATATMAFVCLCPAPHAPRRRRREAGRRTHPAGAVRPRPPRLAGKHQLKLGQRTRPRRQDIPFWSLHRGPQPGLNTTFRQTLGQRRNSIYVGTGNNYSVPQAVGTCFANNRNNPYSNASNDYFNSVVSLDLTTGAVKWATPTLYYDVSNDACGSPSGQGACPSPEGPD